MSNQTSTNAPSHAISNLDDLLASNRATITRSEAARVLELDRRTLDQGLDSGVIPCLRVGRRIVIPRLKFIAMLSAADAA